MVKVDLRNKVCHIEGIISKTLVPSTWWVLGTGTVSSVSFVASLPLQMESKELSRACHTVEAGWKGEGRQSRNENSTGSKGAGFSRSAV